MSSGRSSSLQKARKSQRPKKSPGSPTRGVGFPIRNGPVGDLVLPSGKAGVDSYGKVTYYPEFLTCSEGNVLYEQMLDGIAWKCTPISFFGKTVMQPRDTAFYGTELYTYSDENRPPIDWEHDAASRALLLLKTKIEEKLELPEGYFNVALCNRYMDGSKYMGYHADDEKSLGKTPLIASVSVGAERRFLLRPKPCALGAERERIEYVLAHGSLVVMSGYTQEYYKHALPKAAGVVKPRVNLTFRRVLVPEKR